MVTCGTGRTNEVPEILSHVAPLQPELTRNRGHRARLDGENLAQLFSEGQGVIRSAAHAAQQLHSKDDMRNRQPHRRR